MKKRLLLSLCTVALWACQPSPAVDEKPSVETEIAEIEAIGAIEMVVPGIVSPDAKVENLGGSFGWSEGPVWIAEQDRLLFTDVPGNVIWTYKDGEGLSEFLNPSGHAEPVPAYTSSAGANGLIRLNDEEILLPDHGSRGLYALNLKTKEKRLLVEKFDGKQFNSPNDAVLHSNGIIFFTDPPYGLKGQDESEAKEIPFNGVYAFYPNGDVKLIDDSLTRPNGIILSPDERTLYVANSDPENAIWKAYPVSASGDVSEGKTLFDATADFAKGEVGNADGMAVDTEGRLYVTGPGGVIILTPEGKRLGLIRTGKRIANVTFGGADGSVLYMTSHDILARVPTLVKGHGL
jgi:gluconolactonase